MLSCDLHDYIEIACMYHLPVELVMRDGHRISGTAMDTASNAEKQECIVISDEGGQGSLIVLDELKSMRALASNPHFKLVKF